MARSSGSSSPPRRIQSFLAAGGDGFSVFNQGTAPLGGAIDIDALVDAFTAAGAAGIAVPPLDRIGPIVTAP